jgi:hypothetical protein
MAAGLGMAAAAAAVVELAVVEGAAAVELVGAAETVEGLRVAGSISITCATTSPICPSRA